MFNMFKAFEIPVKNNKDFQKEIEDLEDEIFAYKRKTDDLESENSDLRDELDNMWRKNNVMKSALDYHNIDY
jgi:IS1 family transposase